MRIKTLLKKWWFSVIVVLLIPLIWYVWGYVTWQLDRQDMLAENRSAYLGWLKMEAEQRMLKEEYENDNYGGGTPEETLKMLISALQKRDLETATLYYAPEYRAEVRDSFSTSVNRGFLDEYVNALQLQHEVTIYDNGTKADIDFFKDGEQSHFEQMILNPYSKKWKMVER